MLEDDGKRKVLTKQNPIESNKKLTSKTFSNVTDNRVMKNRVKNSKTKTEQNIKNVLNENKVFEVDNLSTCKCVMCVFPPDSPKEA